MRRFGLTVNMRSIRWWLRRKDERRAGVRLHERAGRDIVEDFADSVRRRDRRLHEVSAVIARNLEGLGVGKQQEGGR